MKKIIPFSKDILFNTNIYEINSISLEHNLNLKTENELTGEFIISGDYKESDNSIKDEPFIFNLPFDINLDNKYEVDNVKLDIDNFEYELVNNDTLKINIIISLDGVEVIDKEENIIEVIDKVDEPVVEETKEVFNDASSSKEATSIFDNFEDDNDTYVTYNVHIYREKDDINEIIKKYNTSKEELEEYNDLSTISLGSKIIIPSNE
ncbi:MAG: hypothetical protein IJH20_04280 [Bacilli bacterium]|nr:hypothetical protein [Bacilli bacterium]